MKKTYIRKAHYHETDQMGIVHHSNYIKWFEEARIHMMDLWGISYRKMEEEGIQSPVLGINCDYKSMVRFDDEVHVKVSLTDYNSIRFGIKYEVTDYTGNVVYATGNSKHCFINTQQRVTSLKKSSQVMHQAFEAALAESTVCQ